MGTPMRLSWRIHSESGGESTVDLPPEVFGAPVRRSLLFEAVRAFLARQRAGTHATKTRGEVSGGGKKPWRQKGTGRARAGSTRSPLWVGGGTVFGPKPRDYGYELPKAARREALRSALSAKVKSGDLVLVDTISLAQPKTRHLVEFLRAVDVESALIVTPERDPLLERAARNLPGVDIRSVGGLSVYDLLRHRKVVMVASVIERLKDRLAK